MAIAFKAVSVSSITSSATSMTGTLPTFAAGDLLIVHVAAGDTFTSMSLNATGWTAAPWTPTTDSTTGAYATWWKIADGSETDLSLTWTTSAKPQVTIASYSGVDATTPVVASGGGLQTSNNSTPATPTVNNTGTGVEWAVALFNYRTTTSSQKTNTWTPPTGMTERSDANQSANASAPWMSTELADSNGAVASGNHSYTATDSGSSSSHKFAALLYLNPASSGSNLTQNMDDSVTMSDAVTFGPGLGLADSVTMSDAIAMGVGLGLADTLTLADALATGLGLQIDDAVTLADSVNEQLTSGGQALTQNIDDTVTLADALAFGVGLGIDDNVALADALSNGLGLSLTDAVAVADAISNGVGLSLADSVALADNTSFGIGLGVDDAISLVDALANDAGLSLDDALTVADHVSFLLNGQPFPQTVKAHVRAYFVTKFGFYT